MPNILVVDDQEPIRALLKEVLSKADASYGILEATAFSEALAILKGPASVDLILLDVMMPEVDGFEACRQLKADPSLSDIPVIFVTALEKSEDKVRGFEAGGVDYITKPFDPAELKARVATYLKFRKAERQRQEDRKALGKKSEELKTVLDEALQSRKALFNLLKENNQVREKLEQSSAQVQKDQQMLLQSEKLASIGQLAAGIAHEINNPTSFIGSNLSTLECYMNDITRIFRVMELLKAAIEAGDIERAQKIEREVVLLEKEIDISYLLTDTDNLLRESKEGVDRIRNIVRDLKMFSHTKEDTWVLASLCGILDGVINIVWSEIKYKAELQKDYRDDPSILCNPQQIGQVFINLLVNAVQAIKDKGVIAVKTYVSEGLAHIEISDTGCGIPQENRYKVFDAFFTTKEPGKGTGLGLGISASIIKKHGGVIDLESEVGRGTTFKISLPLNAPGGTEVKGERG